MKPRRHLFRSTSPFSTPLRYGVPVILGFAVFITGTHLQAADLLRGGNNGSGSAPASGSTSGGTTPSTIETSRANAKDALARTSQALAAVQAMQNAARNAAINNALNNAGANPNAPGQTLPDVPNGLGTGGLQTAPGVGTDPTKWTGAELPTQTTDGTLTNVTIRQTAQQALLNWQTFNVGKNTTITFDQTAGGASATQWIAFNKINDPSGNPTQILGQIKAVGQVYLINQNGIIFGGSSQVNVHTLVASALPINDTLVANGLLNNPAQEYLFNGLTTTGKLGDVTVQAGAKITSQIGNDGNGGRVFLTGANVTNAGSISTAGGQTILAAGLQVGILAHSSDDPSIRGLDAYVGAVTDPASVLDPYAGTATNTGLIEAARGNVTITGKEVNQSGVVESSTSVALNGSVSLLANYGAIKNAGYRSEEPSTGEAFIYTETGTVTLGEGSLTRILPEYGSTATTAGTALALRSQISVQGKNVHLADNSEILAPSAKVTIKAGKWAALSTGPYATFLTSDGQIYIDNGARINLAGTTDATASVLQNYLEVTLRGSELSVAPLQRDGVLRGDSIIVDITKSGTYNGVDWVGTPLADVSGYLNLIERDISQLTTAGGTLDLSAGDSVVIRDGANIDVSGGWTNFVGDTVQTTQLWTNGRLVDIADATPDQVYDGIFTGTTVVSSPKWGVTKSFLQALAPSGIRYEASYTQGANAGGISITAPAVALDGTLKGTTVAGARQIRSSSTSSSLPTAASLVLKLQAQVLSESVVYDYAPTQPDVIFGSGEQGDVAEFDSDSSALSAERTGMVYLSENLVSRDGFGNLTVVNEGGDIFLPADIILTPQAGSSIHLTAANIDVQGSIISAGSSVAFTTLNLTSYEKSLLIDTSPSPVPNAGRGVFTLGASAVLNTAGLLTDDRTTNGALAPITTRGGNVTVDGYTVRLESGSVIDVSGGYVLNSANKGTYGNAGAITINAGKDPGQHTVLGGTLLLNATLKGYSGSRGGTLNIQAPAIQLGGTTTENSTLLLQPDFFNQGGFSTFKLSGLGVGSNPGMIVSAGTEIAPVVKSYEAVINPIGSGALSLRVIEDIVGKRNPVNITLASPGVRDLTIFELGETVIEEGAVIRTDPGGSVSLTGNTVTVLGSIITPGGSISVGGGSSSVFGAGFLEPKVTTLIGSTAVLSAAGTVVYTPDPYGRRTGKVLAGGSISITGNIAASTGAVLDVSGASAVLDIDKDVATPNGSPIKYSSGLTASLGSIETVAVKVDSNAGSISLRGNEVVVTDATLLANAGGSTALGGSLIISSGLYDAVGNGLPSSTISLRVNQNGGTVAGAIGSSFGNGGHFSVDSFSEGGFDSLALNGVVSFDGAINISARGELSVASNGFIYANGVTHLSASHVVLGQSQAVVLPANETNPFSSGVLPTYGSGNLTVRAGLIDLGHLSLQQIGSASFIAENGEIRGSGTVQIAGDITLRAGQIYPNTASKLTFIAYDHMTGGITQQSHITVQSSGGPRSLPLSAGGTLSLYASNISQQGTLRAPFGTINLGWDGTGTAPLDLLAGSAGAGVFPVTKNLTLGAGSVTSVSAIDPITGKGVVIPYGISTDGENWIDPRGVDITNGGAPEKTIILSGVSLTTEEGSSIDLRGGGDLYAYRWVKGLGGPSDILASSTSFAIIPSYSSDYAPVSEYNASNNEENLISGNSGYTNSSLKVGDRIYLSGSATLPAGYYTLLPARYALLPGAVLVTPTGGSGSQTIEMPDSSSVVSGFRYNSLNSERTLSTISTRFEVASSGVVRARAEYENYLANTFLKAVAQASGNTSTRLPLDSGHLVFQASQAMELLGEVASISLASGRGSAIDISTPLNTIVTSAGYSSSAGTIFLDSETLSSFGAESLLIGGRRTSGADGAVVTVTSGDVTVDNAGSLLSAQDLVLVAKNNLIITDGSTLSSSGTLATSDDLIISGNGTLVRVSADKEATILRSGITSGSSPLLAVGAATLNGGSIILDSSSGLSLSPAAELISTSYQFNAGSVALLLDNPGTVAAGNGLVVSNALLQELQGASALKILSYSSLDLYGTGTFGSTTSLASLTLSAGQIRGINTAGGVARISSKILRLENSANVTSSVSAGATDGTLELIADSIELGSNSLAINGYTGVALDSSKGIIGQKDGVLNVQKDLTVFTPVLAGAAGVTRTVGAGGVLSLEAAARTSTGILSSGLGSTLTATGSSVNVNTTISLPSGSVTLRANSGDLAVNRSIDVSGTAQRFHDVTKLTSAGNITLAATSGNVVLGTDSILNLSGPAAGGNGGKLSVSTPVGSFSAGGTIRGQGGNGGTNGSFSLDVLSLPSLASLSSTLSFSNLDENLSIRVRTGNVLIDGLTVARDFELSTDQGDITVVGTIDGSGQTGGSIHLAAHGNLTTLNGSLLTVAGQGFSSAGKGGSITVESGSQINGVVGTGVVDIQTGSVLNLSVASKIAGSAATAGTSAYNGQFSGKLHIRAPRTSSNTDLLVNAINGNIIDASSILVEGYKLYDLTSSGSAGTITSTIQSNVNTDAINFLGAAGTTTANYTAITNRLLANNAGLGDALVLAPGVEIINRAGDLTLGTSSSTTTSDWNLSTFRYGAKSSAGVLTLRASQNLVFYNALSDGFVPTLSSSNTSWLWTARLITQNALLPVNEQSWSYRLTAGADLGASDYSQVVSTSALAADKGSLKLGKTGTNVSTTSGTSATTATAITNRFQVIRTGSGDIDINAARDVQILNQFSTIYTAGTRVADFTMGGVFRVPSLSGVDSVALGVAQQSYSVQFSMAGGDVNISAGNNIERLTLTNGVLVADSQFQMPTNWLYRRGYVDGTGAFGKDGNGTATSTSWWVDFSNFFQGVGALGGGDVTLVAGNNISNVDAVIPTNARMPGYTSSAQTQNATPDASLLVELGGGDLTVKAGKDIDAGVYYVERGKGTLRADGTIHTNATRSVLTGSQSSSYTQLPTTLFLGKGGFDISANGDILLGPVSNPFLLPAGQLNGYANKSYFSTYGEDSHVTVSSLGGDVTLRTAASNSTGAVSNLLQLWYRNKLQLTSSSASNNKPWLRLSETNVDPFETLFTLQPGTLDVTSFSGDVSLVGNLLLSPSADGNAAIYARQSINALQPNGLVSLNGITSTSWGSSWINLSDADPAAIPGIASPFGYQGLAGTGSSAATTGSQEFLSFISLLFEESGATLGNNITLQTKQKLHAAGLLHANDDEPLRLYAGEGDISGLTLYSSKFARVIAGRDISDISFYIQNNRTTDTSIVASGSNLLPYTTASALLQIATSSGNALNAGSIQRAGDIQISGPGTLQVLAGKNLDLGTGANNSDGTGTGITSIGNIRNPYLAEAGANLVVGAGVGLATGLSGSDLHLSEFIQSHVLTESGQKYLEEIQPGIVFADLSEEEQARVAIEVFYRILRDAGRNYAETGNYESALAAIEVLFGSEDSTWDGDILARSRDIRTVNGGNISILVPGGGVALASTTTGSTLAPPGIITAGGGTISIFAHDDINIGIGRIFTLRGGDEILWSTKGDIAAGSSSKTVQSASPTRVRIDPQTATVQTDLSSLATGGGIGVLNTVKGVEPGDVDLIAPEGFVDAGDAGIRVSGNLNIAAAQVLNSANISVGGTTAGAPTTVSAGANVGSLTAAATTTAATTNAAATPANQQTNNTSIQEVPSLITVEVIGYGGSDDEDDDEENSL